MRRGERIFIGLIGAVGALFIGLSLQLPYSDDFVPAAGYLPLWIAIVLVVLVGLQLWSGRASTTAGEDTDARARRPALVFLGLAACVTLVSWVGFGLAIAAYTAFLLSYVERADWRVVLVSAIAVPSIIVLVFRGLLSVPLPRGPFGF